MLVYIARNDHNSFGVTDYNVSWKDRDVAAADGNIDVNGLMKSKICWGGGPAMVGREPQRCNIRGITRSAISYNSGDAALHQSRYEDTSGRSGAGVHSAIYDKNAPWRTLFDCLALGMLAVFEHSKRV